MPNPLKLRNIPDFEMAMRVKEKLDMPIIFDPSHTGGTPENALMLTKWALDYNFNGFFVEVHTNPVTAKTDSKQQLNLQQFERILRLIEQNSNSLSARG